MGIGVRHGCFCAHPYLLRLLGVGPDAVAEARAEVLAGDRRNIPGAVRASGGLGTTDDDVDTLLSAVAALAAGEPAPVPYRQDPATGDFWPEAEGPGGRRTERPAGAGAAPAADRRGTSASKDGARRPGRARALRAGRLHQHGGVGGDGPAARPGVGGHEGRREPPGQHSHPGRPGDAPTGRGGGDRQRAGAAMAATPGGGRLVVADRGSDRERVGHRIGRWWPPSRWGSNPMRWRGTRGRRRGVGGQLRRRHGDPGGPRTLRAALRSPWAPSPTPWRSPAPGRRAAAGGTSATTPSPRSAWDPGRPCRPSVLARSRCRSAFSGRAPPLPPHWWATSVTTR